jgi:hypothetical protein
LLLPIVVVPIVVSADTAADVAAAVCTSSAVNGVAATIRANMSIVIIITIVFVDFLTVISLSSLLYAFYDLTGPFCVLSSIATSEAIGTIWTHDLRFTKPSIRESAARVVSKLGLRCQLEF